MAFDHQNFATHGLYPGLVTTRSVANVGHFKLEVIIELLPDGPPGSAGGAISTRGRPKKDKYKVTIRVMYKTRIWELERELGQNMANVTAKFLGTELPEDPNVSVTVHTVDEKSLAGPLIKVFKK